MALRFKTEVQSVVGSDFLVDEGENFVEGWWGEGDGVGVGAGRWGVEGLREQADLGG